MSSSVISEFVNFLREFLIFLLGDFLSTECGIIDEIGGKKLAFELYSWIELGGVATRFRSPINPSFLSGNCWCIVVVVSTALRHVLI